MRRSRALAVVIFLGLTLGGAACGDDGATPTAATSAPTSAPTSSSVTTTAPLTTTTAPPTTTLTGDQHPSWGSSWSAMWPSEGAEATYRVQIMGSNAMDLPARLEYDLEWRGGIWDALVIGTLEPGQFGIALYFSRPEPWVLRLWGVAQTSAERTDIVYEYFAEPQELDLTRLPDNPPTIAGSVIVEHGFGTFGPTPAVFTAEWVGVEDLTVAAGTLPGSYHLRFGLGGDFYLGEGGGEVLFSSDLWLHPQQFLVKWEPGPGGGPIELSSLWASPAGA